MLREDYLQQNAYHEVDMYCALEKQHAMLFNIMEFNKFALQALEQGVEINKIIALPVVEAIGRMKYLASIKDVKAISGETAKQFASLRG
jgi:V/A-type H+-transporting ATPase subunit A